MLSLQEHHRLFTAFLQNWIFRKWKIHFQFANWLFRVWCGEAYLNASVSLETQQSIWQIPEELLDISQDPFASRDCWILSIAQTPLDVKARQINQAQGHQIWTSALSTYPPTWNVQTIRENADRNRLFTSFLNLLMEWKDAWKGVRDGGSKLALLGSRDRQHRISSFR